VDKLELMEKLLKMAMERIDQLEAQLAVEQKLTADLMGDDRGEGK